MDSFTIDLEYVTDVSVRKEWNHIADKPNKTATDIADLLKGKGHMSSLGHIDHPEFTKLRDSLENQGFISTVRNSWNGDRVLKEFMLNGLVFKIGDKFYCAGAMRYHLDRPEKHRAT